MSDWLVPHGKGPKKRRLRPAALWTALLVLLTLANLVWLGLQASGYQLVFSFSPTPFPTPTASPSPEPSSSPTPAATGTSTPLPPTATAAPSPLPTLDTFQGTSLAEGVGILAMVQDGHSNLFLYQPAGAQLTRLTDHPWDEIDPAFSPDGRRVAYASRENGYWNIRLLDLATGESIPLTDTPEYDANPDWSPDGALLLFESNDGNRSSLRIVDLSGQGSGSRQVSPAGVSLHDPAWSPDGQQVAAILEDGQGGVLALYAYQAGALSGTAFRIPSGDQPSHPTFSRDGKALIWSAWKDGQRRLFFWEIGAAAQSARPVATGSRGSFSPDGQLALIASVESNRTYLGVLSLQDGRPLLPLLQASGSVEGLDWHLAPPELSRSDWVQALQESPRPPLYHKGITPVPEPGRVSLAVLPEVQLEYPYLSDLADESFAALRQRVISETGWDALVSIESAYIPLTQAADPAGEHQWLRTGRAVLLNRLPLDTGWMTLVKEKLGTDTYWRVYLRAYRQDGSLGRPVHARAWDINSRFSTDPAAYENGGREAPLPLAGYWVDFTELANRYDWHRFPALPEWTRYYPAARYALFVLDDGLSLEQALMQIYPPQTVADWVATTNPTAVSSPQPVHTAGPTPVLTLFPTWTPRVVP